VEYRFCDEGPFGFSWMAADQPATLTSHALVDDDRVWLIDPLDWTDAIDRAAAAGEPAGVVQLLDRHNRDCADVAGRLGVPHHVVPASLPGSPFEIVEIKRSRRWNEVALWWDATGTLVVAEAIGTNAFFATGGRAGVHLLLRPTPPRRQLGRLEPAHLLVGHGTGLHGREAADGLREALADARTGLPRALVKLPALLVDAVRRRR
jgi:hypothetical protein